MRGDAFPRVHPSSSTMKFAAVLFVLAALVALVAAAEEQPEKRDTDYCYKCAKSYVDCFIKFGFDGCKDRKAEHFTYCRKCTGWNPLW